MERLKFLIDVIRVGAVIEFLGHGLTCHILEALLGFGLFADDLVPECMVFAVCCADHYDSNFFQGFDIIYLF